MLKPTQQFFDVQNNLTTKIGGKSHNSTTEVRFCTLMLTCEIKIAKKHLLKLTKNIISNDYNYVTYNFINEADKYLCFHNLLKLNRNFQVPKVYTLTYRTQNTIIHLHLPI